MPVVVVPRERLIVRAGEVMVSRIQLISKIIEPAKRLGVQLQLRGPANLQGFLDENKPKTDNKNDSFDNDLWSVNEMPF